MQTQDIEALDKRLKDAGMFTLTEMLSNKPHPLMMHAGVNSLESFEQWLSMRYRECLSLKAQLTVDGKENDELYEWSLAHAAVFGEVLAHYKAVVEAQIT